MRIEYPAIDFRGYIVGIENFCFLASPESEFVNGAVWGIDGGSLAWRGTLDVLGMEVEA